MDIHHPTFFSGRTQMYSACIELLSVNIPLMMANKNSHHSRARTQFLLDVFSIPLLSLCASTQSEQNWALGSHGNPVQLYNSLHSHRVKFFL